MNFRKPEHALYQKAGLPDQFWDLEIVPRFKDITTIKNSVQNAYTQAQVYNSLHQNPRQLFDIPRRWRVGAYSSPIEHGMLTLVQIVKEAIRHGMRISCVSLKDIEKVHTNLTDLVFCYNVFLDVEPQYLYLLREAHFKNFHLFYSMAGTLREAINLIQITPDYAFQVHQSAMSIATPRVI